MSKEKRRRERVSVAESVKVIDVMRAVEMGKLVNLHQEGFMLITSEDVAENSLYQLTFQFHEPVDGVAEINVGAECLWVSETDTGQQLWAGFHIMDISQKDVLIISNLLDRLPHE